MHWNALVAGYRNSPFFEYYADDFRVFYEKRYAFLWDFNQELCSLVCDLIDIHPRIEPTTDYRMEFAPGEDDFREAIHPKRNFAEADKGFSPAPYYQVFKEKYGFLPNLSIADLLFNMGVGEPAGAARQCGCGKVGQREGMKGKRVCRSEQLPGTPSLSLL